MKRLLPHSLAARFGLASAGLAAAAVLLVALASTWLIGRQQRNADERLAQSERQFHAANIGSTLRALASRMAEVAGSTILATGLVDSAGKEIYLTPFLNGIRQVNGIPVRVLFTDFEGQEIASNSAGAVFDARQLQWLRESLARGQAAAEVLPGAQGPELLALEPLRYARTVSPEGAVLYKIALRDIRLEPDLHLAWGPPAPSDAGPSVAVDAPAVFQPLQLRVVGRSSAIGGPVYRTPGILALVVVVLALSGALFLIGWRLARVLTRDLSRLEAFSTEVVSADAGERRAPQGGSAEVASLAVSINHMLERLHEQHEVLRQEGAKLAELAQALQAADQRKDEFLAMLAHELRNPLAPISTGAEILRLRATDPQVQRTSEVIARQVAHMSRIVDDLLDVSRVTRGLVKLERAPVDLRAALASALDQVQPLADRRRQQLQLLPGGGAAWVDGDSARLVQVAGNLLQNACKYTPEGGHVSARVDSEGDEVVLRVQDDGIGIAPGFLPELFGLFTQAPRQVDRAQGGLGLGLALVKRLVELHGGSVQAHSEGLGRGATFTVRLPRVQAPASAQPAPAPACAGCD